RRAVILVARLVYVQASLPGQLQEQLLVWPVQRLADFSNDFGQLAAGDAQPDDIAEEFADRRVRGMASPFEVGDQSRQLRAHQAPLLDGRRQGSLVRLLAVHAPILGMGMLFDSQRGLRDVDLLYDTGEMPIAAQATAAAGTDLKQVFLEVAHLLGGKRGAFVLGMTGLAPRPTWPGRIVRWRRLDDVGGRGLGRGRGVFLGCSQLFP